MFTFGQLPLFIDYEKEWQIAFETMVNNFDFQTPQLQKKLRLIAQKTNTSYQELMTMLTTNKTIKKVFLLQHYPLLSSYEEIFLNKILQIPLINQAQTQKLNTFKTKKYLFQNNIIDRNTKKLLETNNNGLNQLHNLRPIDIITQLKQIKNKHFLISHKYSQSIRRCHKPFEEIINQLNFYCLRSQKPNPNYYLLFICDGDGFKQISRKTKASKIMQLQSYLQTHYPLYQKHIFILPSEHINSLLVKLFCQHQL